MSFSLFHVFSGETSVAIFKFLRSLVVKAVGPNMWSLDPLGILETLLGDPGSQNCPRNNATAAVT